MNDYECIMNNLYYIENEEIIVHIKESISTINDFLKKSIDFVENIKSYKYKVDMLYLYDNSPSDNKEMFSSILEDEKCKYVYANGNNDGLGKPINITLTKDNKELTVPVEAGSQAFSFMPEFSINGNKLVAAKINNELCSLDSPLEYDCKVEPVYNNTKEDLLTWISPFPVNAVSM